MFMLVPTETEEGTGSPRADVVYKCEPSCRSWVLQVEQAFNHWAIFAAQEYFLTKKRLWDKLFYSNFQRKSETIGYLIDFLHNLEFSSWMCVLRWLDFKKLWLFVLKRNASFQKGLRELGFRHDLSAGSPSTRLGVTRVKNKLLQCFLRVERIMSVKYNKRRVWGQGTDKIKCCLGTVLFTRNTKFVSFTLSMVSSLSR